MARGIVHHSSADYEWRYEVVDDTPSTWGVKDTHNNVLVGELLEKMAAERLCTEMETKHREELAHGRRR